MTFFSFFPFFLDYPDRAGAKCALSKCALYKCALSSVVNPNSWAVFLFVGRVIRVARKFAYRQHIDNI